MESFLSRSYEEMSHGFRSFSILESRLRSDIGFNTSLHATLSVSSGHETRQIEEERRDISNGQLI